MAYEIPRPGAESTCPDHQAMADVDSESNKGYPAAEQNRAKPKHTPKRARRRSGKPARDTRPDITSLMTELRQINTHLGQLIDQKKRQEGDQAHKLLATSANVPCAPVTSTELYSGSCLLHDEWYSGFDPRISRDLKTYFLAIAGAEWHDVFSSNINRDFFNFMGDRIQVDDRLELIGSYPGRRLGAWDHRALSASEIIDQFSAGCPLRDEWKTRRNLRELLEALETHWSGRLLSSRGKVFCLHTIDLSFKNYSLDALVFIGADTVSPKIRRLGVRQHASDEKGKHSGDHQSFEPDDDARPITGHIWNFDQTYSKTPWESGIVTVFSFESVALILAFIDNIFLRDEEPGIIKRGGIPGMQFEAFHFLRSFCGKWPESRAIRTLSDRCSRLPIASIQMHIRFFHYANEPVTTFTEQRKGFRRPGLQMVREYHSLAASLPSETGKYHSLVEQRISFTFHGLIDEDHPPVFTLIVVGDTDSGRLEMFDGHGVERKPLHVECTGRAAGLCVFQGMVWAAVEKWQKNWLDVLDLLDNELGVSLEDVLDTSLRDKQLFADPFEKSKMYFSVLELLRNMSEWRAQTYRDLKVFDDLFHGPNKFTEMSPCLVENWKAFSQHVSNIEGEFQARISEKHDQIKGLRDGLFNVTTVMEATRSTSLNRHVIVLTIVTVVFLPPSFVATVLNIQAFQKGDVGTTYKITTAILSLITYLVAIFLVIVVAKWGLFKKATVSAVDNAFRTAKTKVSSYARSTRLANIMPEESDSRTSLSSDGLD